MIDSSNDNRAVDEDLADSDVVDFTPDPSQLGLRSVGDATPRWLIAAFAAAAIVVAVAMLRPGPAAASAADAESAPIALPVHQDLFQLPEWHDEPDPSGRLPQKSANQ